MIDVMKTLKISSKNVVEDIFLTSFTLSKKNVLTSIFSNMGTLKKFASTSTGTMYMARCLHLGVVLI